MIGLVILWNIYGSLEFSTIFDWDYAANPIDSGLLRLGLLMMFIGAVGKSAQFPLHVWLPDAMEGPTPVSALIHAATMVNAGLYLVARMFPIFSADGLAGDLSELAILIAWIGGITAFMAAAIAFVQMDIKKVLAYSTMSQLAYIFTGLGAALWFANAEFEGHMTLAYFAFGASLFHLFNHAMAKGMLFMASGSVIHEMHHAHHHAHDNDHDDHFDAQDMSNMGGLASKMPVTATAMAIGSMSIIGIPLIGGFWSKEGIVGKTWEAALHEGGALLIVPAILILVTAGMTGFYMSRMWFMTFAGKAKTDVAKGVHEQTPWIKTPLIVLSCICMLAFAFASMHIVDWVSENHAFKTSTFIHNVLYEIEHAFLPSDTTIRLIGWTTILLSAIIGPAVAMALYGGRLEEGEEANPLIHWLVVLSGKCKDKYNFDNSAWADSPLADALRRRLYFDEWYNWLMLKIFVPFSNTVAWFDKRGVDGVVKGIEKSSSTSSAWIRTLTTGSARDYIMMVALGTLVIFVMIGGVL
jgi:NADH-quinone oxidoreductase subunit L